MEVALQVTHMREEALQTEKVQRYPACSCLAKQGTAGRMD
jgi:hypothetical protein